MVTPELIARLPKAELHTHLDGCLRPATMLELARPAKVELPAKDAASLGRYMLANDARNLEDYLKRFDITVALLQTPEAIERVAYEMVEDAAKDHLRYLEVRYCPHLSTHGGLTMDEVVAAAKDRDDTEGLARALLPLYYGRVAALIGEVEGLDQAGAERVVEQQALVFEQTKPYLLERWSVGESSPR